MKTRTLLLLSLGCGLMIMLAGAVLLVQLTGRDEAVPALGVGASAQVGEMNVVVATAAERDGTLAVDVELGGTDDDDPAGDFRLVASGRALAVADSDCPAIRDDVERCRLSFDVSSADGPSRLLVYERGDDRARWRLD